MKSDELTADDALDNAGLVEWQDIIILGFDESGSMKVMSSAIEVSVAVLLLETLKLHLLTHTERHFDA